LRLLTVRYERLASGQLQEVVNDPRDTTLFTALEHVRIVRTAPHLVAARSNEQWTFWTPGCDRLTRVTDARSAGAVVSQQAWVHELSKPGRQQRIAVDLRVVNPSGAEASGEREYYEAGETASFTVHVSQPAHLLILNLDAEGGIRVLYPYEKNEIHTVQPGPMPLFKAQVKDPFGIDYVLAVVFRQAPDGYAAWVARPEAERKARIAPGTPEHARLKAWVASEAVDGMDVERLVTRGR
jgi:hypothetical protein